MAASGENYMAAVTYNRRRRVLFPDIDGFRDAFLTNQLEY
jgi:hypothetical protein